MASQFVTGSKTTLGRNHVHDDALGGLGAAIEAGAEALNGLDNGKGLEGIGAFGPAPAPARAEETPRRAQRGTKQAAKLYALFTPAANPGK